jgi:hypothetical protein
MPIKITAPKHLTAHTQELAAKGVGWLAEAKRSADQVDFASASQSTETWLASEYFGVLNRQQTDLLRKNISALYAALSYAKTELKIVDLKSGHSGVASRNAIWSMQSPAIRVTTELSLWNKSDIADTNACIVFRQLAMSVLGFNDIGPKEGYADLQQGSAKVKVLARTNSDHALKNPDSISYYIGHINELYSTF